MRFYRTSAARVFVCAAVLVLASVLEASAFTNVQAHSLNVGSDTHKIYVYNGTHGSGTLIGTKVLSGTQIAVYYSAGCSCYEVPLSIISYVSGYSAADAVSGRQQHLSPNLPSGQELTIEILDERAALAGAAVERFGAKPFHLWRSLFVGIFDGRVVGGGSSAGGKR
jgi:hypothetical protein